MGLRWACESHNTIGCHSRHGWALKGKHSTHLEAMMYGTPDPGHPNMTLLRSKRIMIVHALMTSTLLKLILFSPCLPHIELCILPYIWAVCSDQLVRLRHMYGTTHGYLGGDEYAAGLRWVPFGHLCGGRCFNKHSNIACFSHNAPHLCSPRQLAVASPKLSAT